MADPDRYIGLMSGTSIDAVDAVLVEFTSSTPRILAACTQSIPANLHRDILSLCLPGADTLDLLGSTDRALAILFADTALALLSQTGLQADQITAIGSHGQTVRHRPNGAHPFTLQIADPNLIAARTGITTVADFRRKDMALGGQGAPLVPAFHKAVFQHQHHNRAIINIGGIANITWIPASGAITGFDTGPGNCLMDAWIRQHTGHAFDANGAWAASGHVDQTLLDRLLAHPFVPRPAPKSTGREEFNLPWLDSVLNTLAAIPAPPDIQATLALFTARSIAQGLASLPGNQHPDEVYVCGGGVHNGHLIGLLADILNPTPVRSTAAAGIDPGHVEGAAFAWLARQTLHRLPGSLAAVTGASRDTVLGTICFP
ncbi:MAG: hypothetical protein VR73_12810 [Gammaproteobacteria bacterium BRH_c0]|nr:MAG: hypothetical protein VR73_12810 [Gammaproteobacteria bacterium BRH_c0]